MEADVKQVSIFISTPAHCSIYLIARPRPLIPPPPVLSISSSLVTTSQSVSEFTPQHCWAENTDTRPECALRSWSVPTKMSWAAHWTFPSSNIVAAYMAKPFRRYDCSHVEVESWSFRWMPTSMPMSGFDEVRYSNTWSFRHCGMSSSTCAQSAAASNVISISNNFDAASSAQKHSLAPNMVMNPATVVSNSASEIETPDAVHCAFDTSITSRNSSSLMSGPSVQPSSSCCNFRPFSIPMNAETVDDTRQLSMSKEAPEHLFKNST